MNFKGLIARQLLKLPPVWMQRLAGGGPRTIEGRVMDPHTQLVAWLSAKGEGFKGQSPQQARAMMQAAQDLLPGTAPSGVTVRDDSFPSSKASIPVRIYQPDEQNPRASVLVYFHGGGGVAGDLDMCHAFCAVLAKFSKRPVISVAYRLAPEFPWPQGLEDCLAGYRWALARAEHLGAPEGRAAVGGDSMGANYAAAICQDVKQEGAPAPDFQLLIYPALDFEDDAAFVKSYAGVFPMTQDWMDFFKTHFLSSCSKLDAPRLSPLNQTELSDLPAALIICAGFDPLQDQARLYHERLGDAGNLSELVCYESLSHGFVSLTGASPAAQTACEDIARRIMRYTA